MNVKMVSPAQPADAPNDRFEALVKFSPYCIHELDADGHIVSMNPAGLRMMGAADLCEIVGSHYLSAVCTRDRPRLEHLLKQAREGKFSEFEFESINGRTFQSNFVPLPPREGSPARLMGITLDVTDRRRLERQLGRDRRLEALGRLAGGMAHDFNNLLTVILGTVGLLAARAGEDQQGELEAIRDAAQRGASLTSQLLAFARRQFVRPTVVDLSLHLTGARRLLRRLLPENIALEIIEHSPDLGIEIDPGQLDQLLLNLAANAGDAMPQGGTLRIEVERTQPDEKALSSTTDLGPGPYVRLRVSDDGRGMTPEVAERVFEPFYTTRASSGGTGLGLATCHGIVRQAGGSITVESRKEEGTTFVVHLPLVDLEEGRPRNVARAESREERMSGRIFVVEDDPAVRRAAVRSLEAPGFRAVAFATGEEALAAVRSGDPVDLLFSDVVLPGISGPELAARCREVHPGLPVLLTSGYSDRESLASLGERDCSLLAKPYEQQDLVDAVRILLAAAAEIVDASRP